ELNVVVADDLYPIAPGIPKIQERPVERRDTGCFECFAGRFFIIDDKSEVPAIVCGLPATLLQGDELIAEVDEGHGVAPAAEFEREDAAVERQRFADISNFKRDVVET